MDSDTISIPYKMGTVAAILTGIEFAIGKLAIVSLGPVLYAIYMMRRQWRGKRTLRRKDIKYHSCRIELIGLIITLWFTIAIALVETTLDCKLTVGTEKVIDSNCARMDEFYDCFSKVILSFPYHYSIDEWSLNIARQVSCTDGLQSVHFGGCRGRVLSAGEELLSAPTCINKKNNNQSYDELEDKYSNLKRGKVTVGNIYIRKYTNGIYYDNPRVVIFPYHEKVGSSRKRIEAHEDPYKAIPSCENYNISSAPVRYFPFWTTEKADDYSISQLILQKLCDGISRESLPQKVPDALVRGCSHTNFLNFTCVYSRLTTEQQSAVTLYNVSIFMSLDEGKDSTFLQLDEDVKRAAKSVACPDADVKVSFILVSSQPILDYWYERDSKEKNYFVQNWRDSLIIVPVEFDVISGTCEPTLEMLGMSALLHTANAHWLNSSMAAMDKQLLYQTHVISMAKSLFPRREFKRQKTLSEIQNREKHVCALREVVQTTTLQRNYSLVLFIMILVISGMFVLLSLFYLCFLQKRTLQALPVEGLVEKDVEADGCDGPEKQNIVRKVRRDHHLQAATNHTRNVRKLESLSSSTEFNDEFEQGLFRHILSDSVLIVHKA